MKKLFLFLCFSILAWSQVSGDSGTSSSGGSVSANNCSTTGQVLQQLASNGTSTCSPLGTVAATATAQSANITSTNLQINSAVVPAGLYKVVVYTRTSTNGSAGTLAVTIGWNDGGGALTATPIVAMDLTSAVSSSGEIIVRADGTNNITYSTTITGGTGSPAYAIYIALERIS